MEKKIKKILTQVFNPKKKKKKPFFEVNLKSNGDVAFCLIHLIKLNSNVTQSSNVM
jgi:hypothetical protein